MGGGAPVRALHEPQVVGHQVREHRLRQQAQPLRGVLEVGDVVEAQRHARGRHGGPVDL